MIDTSADKFITDEHGYGQKSVTGYKVSVDKIRLINSAQAVNYLLKSGAIVYPSSYEVVASLPFTIQKQDCEIFQLGPGVYSITCDQGISVPADRMGIVRPRSSLLRIGATINTSFYQPGSEMARMGMTMIVFQSEIIIERHSQVASIVFEKIETGETYDGKWQGDSDFK